ncbi:MAG TPA: PHP domain-containing protein, partial [Blastocatellia bacterium]|nr:PHP domain-containing protein [Blastocatellia bacterium]
MKPTGNKKTPKEKAAAMNKFEIAAALQEISALLRKKNDTYRSRAYATAAKAVAAVGDEFDTLVADGRLTELKGIGDSLAGVIRDLHTTGRSSQLERLRTELPAGVLELSKVGGLTLKKIESLNRLGITSVADLKAAVDAGRLRDVTGFGEKTEAAIREQITRYESHDDRVLLIDALNSAERVVEYMQTYPDLHQIDLAGSARRWKETVSQIRITGGVSKSPESAVKHFLAFPAITQVDSDNRTSATATLIEGLRVTFSAARMDDYWNLLHHETGSKAHVKKLEGIAKKKKLQLTSTKLTPAGKRTALKIKSEADIYRRLDMQYVPPELREDEGEIEDAIAGNIPDDLILQEDITGMIHCHTTYSDGRNTLEEMVLAAEAMGMKYMTITDHSPTAHY